MNFNKNGEQSKSNQAIGNYQSLSKEMGND